MTTYGSTGRVYISTAIDGDNLPSGDVIQLEAVEIKEKRKYGQKVKSIPDGDTYSTKDGRWERYIQITDSRVKHVSGGSINDLRKILDFRHSLGEDTLYLFVMIGSTTDETNELNLHWYDEDGDPHYHLRGSFQTWEIDYKGVSVFKFVGLFREITI